MHAIGWIFSKVSALGRDDGSTITLNRKSIRTLLSCYSTFLDQQRDSTGVVEPGQRTWDGETRRSESVQANVPMRSEAEGSWPPPCHTYTWMNPSSSATRGERMNIQTNAMNVFVCLVGIKTVPCLHLVGFIGLIRVRFILHRRKKECLRMRWKSFGVEWDRCESRHQLSNRITLYKRQIMNDDIASAGGFTVSLMYRNAGGGSHRSLCKLSC